MSVKLHFNSQTCDAAPGNSLFTLAEQVGVLVPTSCNKNGKCKECIVEVSEGMALLNDRTEPEHFGLRPPIAVGALVCLALWVWAWKERKPLAAILEADPVHEAVGAGVPTAQPDGRRSR